MQKYKGYIQWFYHKVIETKCSGHFKLKAEYTVEDKRVRHFCVNKNYCIKYIVNKINGEKEKRTVCTKYFFIKTQYITEVAARKSFVWRLLLKHFKWY